MMKKIVAGTIALTLTGASLALAQSNQASDEQSTSTQPQAHEGYRPSDEDVSAFTDARIAALKAGLKLTADQEKNWPALETALRELAKQRADRRKEFASRVQERREARDAGNEQARPDMYERLRRQADRMTARATAVKGLADAVEPLYKSLDDGQKHRFAMLLRMDARHGFHRHHHGHRRWHDRFNDNRDDR
jgi:zinc resistance-associated protein